MSHYKLLKIAPWATPQEIRQAYRELSKLYHPDTTTLPEATATEKFQQLNEAYGTLSNPDRRSRYDLENGYSRFSAVKPDPSFNQPVDNLFNRGKQKTPVSDRPANNAYLDPSDRPLSPGELFAILLLGVTFIGCILLIVLAGLFRGEIALPAVALLN